MVIYLGVSGSMYDSHCASSPAWAKGRLITLMKNAVHFLETGLLAPGCLAVRPGDTVALRGFYRKVDTLDRPIREFNPSLHPRTVAANIESHFNFNGRGGFDPGNA